MLGKVTSAAHVNSWKQDARVGKERWRVCHPAGAIGYGLAAGTKWWQPGTRRERPSRPSRARGRQPLHEARVAAAQRDEAPLRLGEAGEDAGRDCFPGRERVVAAGVLVAGCAGFCRGGRWGRAWVQAGLAALLGISLLLGLSRCKLAQQICQPACGGSSGCCRHTTTVRVTTA